MKNMHLSEIEIQQYVLNKADCDNVITKHILQCQKCQSEVEFYQLLFTEIKEIPNPVFDFDVADLVIKQLPQRKYLSLDKYFIALLSCISMILLCTLIFVINHYFPTVFGAISILNFLLILIPTVFIISFLYMDMKRNFDRQMKFS
ncbi:hypothetical protein LF887_14940 [Chryseobacterium sp. MEBOG06]|uniref:hypothetical protein n=1 Tax=unclassified Chryseobacterium TaxID=2593645 RepID=UPI001F3DADFE|nr:MULTISPECIES: hypothetical protein [unclassified Chryseobacterium]UKB82300.1 hypothetical protein LF887_14940 [Chryseobacterium sp. MEBOG06]